MLLDYLQLTPEDLETERQQLIDAGRQISALTAEFNALVEPSSSSPDAAESPDWQTAAVDLLDQAADLPSRPEYPYHEPNELEAIRAARPDGPRSLDIEVDSDLLDDRIAGAWVGRCAGCLLGKPVELWTGSEIRSFLRAVGRHPLDDYLRSDVPEHIADQYRMRATGGFVDEVEQMPRDDDIDFTIAALDTVESHGVDFATTNVARGWLDGFPVCRLYTAERVAYRNLCNGLSAPATATTRNPYRELIGAQIRADFYGWICPGQPEEAAELAWRDARLSHVRNGCYGAMWVAAMLAAAPFVVEISDLIRTGLSEIPAESRFAEAIEHVFEWYDDDHEYDEAVAAVGERWDEETLYGKYHVISNAQIVAIALLWSDGFSEAICRAVQAGFDTDCNGATVGSIIGLRLGREALPERWTAPLNDRTETALSGHDQPALSTLATRTVALVHDA